MWSLMLWRETGWAYLGQCFLNDRKEVSPKHMGNVASGATMMHEDVWLLARDAAVRDMQPQGLIKYSLGHGSAVQTWVSLPFPLQSLPPIWGTGALQCLILVICPSPHVAEQEDHGDHRLQPPSWRTRWGEKKVKHVREGLELACIFLVLLPPHQHWEHVEVKFLRVWNF